MVVDGDGDPGDFSVALSLSPSVAGDACPGIPVAIDATADLTIEGDTSFAKPDELGAGDCATSAGNDVVYAVTPSQSGTLALTVAPAANFDAEVYARTGDCDTGAQAACAANAGAGVTEATSFAVTAGQVVSVIVDGKGPSFGSFTLSMHLSGS